MTEDIQITIKDLLNSQKLAVLATLTEDQPYENLVAFVATEDLQHLIFATAQYTRKFANIKANPKVSLLIDNRSNVEVDFHMGVAVTALGEAEEISIPERQNILNFYLKKHPYLENFVTAPSCSFFRVRVCKYILVSDFQKVVEWILTE
ncbi:MAG: pyridoxamine 5'-phosphate oxidase family protein [Candidatus Aminicenantes bacterium]|nr:pyridoxamine 5'-phosphate oxidase family protein [Candidatus Aminicenantes bacterium]